MKQIFKLLFAFLILVTSCTNNKKTDEDLKNIANSLNAQCPIRISDDTQMDSIYSLPEKILVYRYTLSLMDSSSFDKKQFEAERKKFITNTIKSTEDMAYLRKQEVVFRYEYYDVDGKLLSKVVVEPKDYK